jgi:hypothetical protein
MPSSLHIPPFVRLINVTISSSSEITNLTINNQYCSVPPECKIRSINFAKYFY